MESSVALQKEAIKNTFDIARAGTNEHTRIAIILHADGPNAWFITVEGQEINYQDYITLTDNYVENITTAAHRAFSGHPAENYGLILWSHGFGILDPVYDAATDSWNIAQDGDEVSSCTIDTDPLRSKRGILLDNHTKKCMNNAAMVTACKNISENTLKGQKLGFVAMDACLGAMIEHGYQLRNYTDFLVGTQDCELPDGFDYHSLINALKTRNLSPRATVTQIVNDYNSYYAPIATAGRYTLAAIDLSYMDHIKLNLDSIVTTINSLFAADVVGLQEALIEARQECLEFCLATYYKDLHQAYGLIDQKIAGLTLSEDLANTRTNLHRQLMAGQYFIEQAVVANATGTATAAAQGMSIYWPKK